MKSKNIEFEEINVAEDRTAAMEMIQKSNQRGVPVVDINGSIIVGFDVEAINNSLGIS